MVNPVRALTLQRRVVKNLRKRGVQVRTRGQWKTTMAWKYAWRIINRRVTKVKADTLVQHITVTFDDGVLTGDFDADMRELERIGDQRFGSGFSYNFAVDMETGMIGVGMPLLAAGTHTVNDKGIPDYSHNQNYVARAVAMLGMPGKIPSDRCVINTAKLFAALMDEGALTQRPDYVPHSMFAAKDCPTTPVRNAMDRIESMAHALKTK